MRNADMPAMPNALAYPSNDGYMITLGLTKREYFAAHMQIDSDEIEFHNQATLESFLGRTVDHGDFTDMMRAACEVDAKFRLMKADALLAELEKTP